MKMPFGKHKGLDLAEIDPGYLKWVLENCDLLRPRLKRAIEEQLRSEGAGDKGARSGAPRNGAPNDNNDNNDALETIRRWHRDACLRWHPDRGGDTRVMQIFNGEVDRLLAMLSGRGK